MFLKNVFERMYLFVMHTFCHALLAEVVALQFWRTFALSGVHCRLQKQAEQRITL